MSWNEQNTLQALVSILEWYQVQSKERGLQNDIENVTLMTVLVLWITDSLGKVCLKMILW